MNYSERVSQTATTRSAKSGSSAGGSAGRQAAAVQRVVIDARESGTTTGRYVDKLIEYLHKLKPSYEIVILTKSPRVEYMRKIAPGFSVIESNFKEFTFAEQIGFLRQLKNLRADLVHFSMTQQPVLYRGNSVTTIHDLTTARFNNPSKSWLVFKFKQLVYKWVIKRVARKSERLIVPSLFVKQDVAQFARVPERKITVTYEAADKITVPARPIAPLAGKQFIMYVGRAQPHKNLQRAAEAFTQLKTDYPGLHFVLVGRIDDGYRRLQKYTENKHIKGVIFTDFVSEGNLRWLYENAQTYVFPSLSEGFGLPGLEALAHGLPLVSSNATSLPEIYGDAALYLDPQGAGDITAKIKMMLDDNDLAAKLHRKGPGQAAKYSWQQMAEQTLDIYKEALA